VGAEAAADLPRPLAQLRRQSRRSSGRARSFCAFELGITHFDLANKYGPPYGSAEETFGQILRKDLAGHRDEIVVSTKAGWHMWPGPYGDGAALPCVPCRNCPCLIEPTSAQ
jgi:aryl-alcohol dehydrogenase-like predicted oxidoreductase